MGASIANESATTNRYANSSEARPLNLERPWRKNFHVITPYPANGGADASEQSVNNLLPNTG
jgi:hypothetical protein